jgi:hypothetical protein
MKLRKYINERKEIKVWLDDERKAPSGWIHFKTVPEIISFYEKNHDKIIEMSLDHDLGENTPTGYDFVLWLEEKIHFNKYNNIPDIKVHSANPVGKKRMLQAISSIEKKLKNKDNK